MTRTLDIVNFRSSYGWFDRWNARNNVKFKPVSGAGKKLIHQPYRQGINWRIFFNSDEFGLFFQVLPNKTLELKGGKCSGGKHSKARLTGMSATCATGEKLPLLVIGKSQIRDASRTLRPCNVSTKHNQKYEWRQRSLQIG